MLKRTVTFLLLFSTVAVLADGDRPEVSSREKNKAIVGKAYNDNLKKYKGNENMLVFPGLLADRTEKKILIQAEATGLRGGEIAEFFLIAENSGHGYEALAVSFSKPSDIHKALVFIGMKPGRSVDPKKLQFWPKGERVLMTFTCEGPETAVGPVRAEKLILNSRTGKPLPETGFVFTGSVLVDSCEKPGLRRAVAATAAQAGKKVYAADIREPNSIASNYNEPESVFDVPRRARQGEVYGLQSVNPEFLFPAGRLLLIVIEPEYKEGKKRVMELFLDVNVKKESSEFRVQDSGEEKRRKNAQRPTSNVQRRTGEEGSAKGGRTVREALLDDIEFRLYGGSSSSTTAAAETAALHTVLKEFASLVGKGHDPFVTLRFDDKLTLKAVHDLCVILSSIESEKGIRIEPPLPGCLYYKAFIPDESFRDRTNRISQPWEFHLFIKNSKITGILTQIEQIWKDDKVRPDLKATDYNVANPEALRKELDNRGPGLPVILVFAQSAVTHGQLMTFLKPVLSTHPTIHVFVE